MSTNPYDELPSPVDEELPEADGISGRRAVTIILLSLGLLLLAFIGVVSWARSTLPQEEEIITVEEAAQLIQEGQVERILVQTDELGVNQDLFLYLPGQARPLYARLEPGQSITETLRSLGVPDDRLPPIEIEVD